MRTIVAVVLICLLSGYPRVFAAEPKGGVLTAAALREAARVTPIKTEVIQQQAGSHGHPVLIGAIIGTSVGAVVGYAGTSCSVPPPDDYVACGEHYKAAGAVLFAGLGAAVGALIGLVFRH